MVGRKEKLGKKIDTDILETLKQSKNPISTRDLAQKVGRAWYSVQTHCLRLQLEGKIKGFRITNIHVWEMKR